MAGQCNRELRLSFDVHCQMYTCMQTDESGTDVFEELWSCSCRRALTSLRCQCIKSRRVKFHGTRMFEARFLHRLSRNYRQCPHSHVVFTLYYSKHKGAQLHMGPGRPWPPKFGWLIHISLNPLNWSIYLDCRNCKKTKLMAFFKNGLFYFSTISVSEFLCTIIILNVNDKKYTISRGVTGTVGIHPAKNSLGGPQYTEIWDISITTWVPNNYSMALMTRTKAYPVNQL